MIKELILTLFIFLMVSCIPQKKILNQNKKWYDNYEWYYVYNGDTSQVWVNFESKIQGINIRDTETLNDTTIIGFVKPFELIKKIK